MSKLNDQHLRILEKQNFDCQDVADLLCDYADQELTGTLAARLDGHCLHCESCAEVRDSYLLTIKVAKTLRDCPMPRDVQRRLRQALNQRLGLNLAC